MINDHCFNCLHFWLRRGSYACGFCLHPDRRTGADLPETRWDIWCEKHEPGPLQLGPGTGGWDL